MKIENSLIWVTSAKTVAGHKLELTFNDGSVKIFDCTPLIERYKIFEPLKNESVFENFSLAQIKDYPSPI